jgi:hypothetical protein
MNRRTTAPLEITLRSSSVPQSNAPPYDAPAHLPLSSQRLPSHLVLEHRLDAHLVAELELTGERLALLAQEAAGKQERGAIKIVAEAR